jgi:hypothetical protein
VAPFFKDEDHEKGLHCAAQIAQTHVVGTLLEGQGSFVLAISSGAASPVECRDAVA